MIIQVQLDGAVTLEDIDNFKAFNVASACGAHELEKALTSLGRLDAEGNAWISRAWLLAKGRPDDAKWLAGFEAMHDYASTHGWVDSEMDTIRAHVEYLSS